MNIITGTLNSEENIVGKINSPQIITANINSGVFYAKYQSDWQQADTENPAYIKNKPTSLSQFTNDVGFINEHQDLSAYAKLTDIPSTNNFATKSYVDNLIPTVPSVISAFTNDVGYLTQHQDISGKVDKQTGYSLVSNADVQQITTNKNNINTLNGSGEGSVMKAVADAIAQIVSNAPSDFDTLKEISDWISSHTESVSAMNSAIAENTADIQSLENDKQNVISDLATIRNGASLGATALQTHQDISGKADTSSLSTVATSGSYNDLSDKPTIPSIVTDEHINELIDAKLGVIENGSY